MILSALFSFLGGSAFRAIWGEIAAYFDKKMDHQFEMERMSKQGDLDQAAHERLIEQLRLQNELGIKTIQVQGEQVVNAEDAKAFGEAMKGLTAKTGNKWVDAWNGGIRPLAATIVLLLWVWKLAAAKGVMDAWDTELAGAVLGFFFANRSLGQRGK